MRDFSIRKQVMTGAFLLGTLPLLLLSFVLPPRIEKTLIASAEGNLVLTATSLSRMVQHMLFQHVETLAAIGNSEFLNQQLAVRNHGTNTQENLNGVNRRLKGFMNALTIPYEAVFVSDAKGTVFVGLTKEGDTTPFVHLDIQDRDYFTKCRNTLEPQIAGPMISKVSGKPVVVVSFPLKDPSGGFAGLIGLSLNADYLSKIVVDQSLGSSINVFAIDKAGQIAAHADPAQILGGQLVNLKSADQLAKRMKAGETGLEHFDSTVGDRRVAAFAPVPIVGWSMAVTQSENEFTNEAARMRREIVIILGACIAAALLGAWIFSNGLTKTLRHAIQVVAHAVNRVDKESVTIAANAAKLAEVTSLQSSGVEVTSSAITELAATTKSISIRAGAVAAIVRRTDPKLHESKVRLEKRLEELNRQSGNSPYFQKLGETVTSDVNREFEMVREESRKIGTLIDEIADACKAQATDSETIITTISQFEKGVHAGAATAQQSAAAAELLKAQVVEISRETAHVQQLIDGSHH